MTPVNKEQLSGKELMQAECFGTATGHLLVNSEMWINDLSTPPCCTVQLWFSYCLGMLDIQAQPDCFWLYWFIKSRDTKSLYENSNTNIFSLAVGKTKHFSGVVLHWAVSFLQQWQPQKHSHCSTDHSQHKNQRYSKEGSHTEYIQSSQTSNKDCCCRGLQTCPQSSTHCCLGDKWILTVLFVPSPASQSTALWKCNTQCWEIEISRVLDSAMLLYLWKILLASHHCFQQKRIWQKESQPETPSGFGFPHAVTELSGASASDHTSLDLINQCNQKQYIESCISDTPKQSTASKIQQLFYSERAPLILTKSLSHMLL